MDAILYNLFVPGEPVDIPKNDALAYRLDDIFPASVNDALGINPATKITRHLQLFIFIFVKS